ncbi:indolepyruvate ferredoxin oxidoreductase family protein [Corynebacterium epidermidicanis]|uniref:Indolepyruvate ferredoxin oxidreductase, alpha/beta subunit n=1 Tax=Corynebacterium epidermidicanis TaxID=1050174 RepID=A0A0G3GZP8_9CORY|nr:indolepyruvate ferredoxin oxidoreductase family protein [Corynebacterium epidermidicanis]AKK04312.1 indolepyruvate ferredoxin oxidreductase, alpha/beta subunit [Corynebacterium epidermidicanis]
MTSLLDPTQDPTRRPNNSELRGFSLEDRYTREDGTIFLNGIQALARMVRDRAVLDRRLGLTTGSFISGYEGSPLAGYDLELARKARKFLEPYNTIHQPALNEEIGATSVMGSQMAQVIKPLDGVTGYWYGKAPGLDRASDALRHANMIGTSPTGGAVAIVGDDPGAKSSTVPCASEMELADLYMPILYPADSQDILDLGVHAALMSRVSGLWTSLKISAHVADGSSTAQVSPDRIQPIYGDLGISQHKPSGHLLGKNLLALEESQLTIRMPRAVEYARLNGLNQIRVRTGDDRIGIVAAGKTYLDVCSAFQRMGISEEDLNRLGIRLLKLGMVYPMDRDTLYRFIDGLDEVIVVEEKRDFIETMIREILYDYPHTPNVRGKTNEDGSVLFSRFGELDIDSVTNGLAKRLATKHNVEAAQRWLERTTPKKKGPIQLPLAARSPYFCSGCPHNSSTKVAEGSLVGAGIGCHAMVLLQPESQVGNVVGVTQMGGEGTQWIGMAPFVKEKHFVQNLGDGTFDHSGSLAVRAAVAAGVNITYKLLFNGTVAMTGGQDPVGGKNLNETLKVLQAEKVAKIVVTTDDVKTTRRQVPSGVQVRHRNEMIDIQRELAEVPGVTVLVHDQHCAAEKRRKRKRGQFETPKQRVVINERICEGCGDCGDKSNCLSVHPVDTEFGRKTRIDQSTCNLDFSCIEGDCPSFMTVTVPDAGVRKQGLNQVKKISAPALDFDALPEPDRAKELSAGESFGMRITGIGGTGVVTVSAVLATAAVIDGLTARTVDMTGLAQKGGAVVSDVKLAAGPLEQAAKVGAGEADLYLCADGLVGADATHLKVASPERSIAVLSTAKVPTGEMVKDTRVTYPHLDDIATRIGSAAQRLIQLNPVSLAEQLFGDSNTANMLLVGAAYQAGALPISADAIEEAIQLNGVAVDRNLQSFRRGRQAVAAPEALQATLKEMHPEPAPAFTQSLADIVNLRVLELAEYQDTEYARHYADRVETVRRAEEATGLGSTALSESVARYLYKLMAYKDEYEVARLAVDPAVASDIEADFGADARINIKLHPPVLRAMGLDRKISLGPWARPVLKGLAHGKRLRGTRFDIFGMTEERRIERELVAEYEQLIDALLARITTGTIDQVWLDKAAELMALPDMVRGFGELKLRNVAAYREAVAVAKQELF